MKSIEGTIRLILISSRWVLAPFYIGLALSLLILLYKFGMSFVELVRYLPESTEADVIVGVLGLVDVALIGSLVVNVIFSGYETFVAKLARDGDTTEWPVWMTKVGFSGMKQKLSATIVAIAAIQLLEAFMNLDKRPDPTRLTWLIAIFAAFVLATLMLAIADRVAGETKSGE